MGGPELGGRLHGARRHGGDPGPRVRRRQRDGPGIRAGTLDGLQHRTGERGADAIHHRRERKSHHEHVPDEQGNNSISLFSLKSPSYSRYILL